MKINGTDITSYGKVKQWRVDIGNRELKNDSEWVRGSLLPFFTESSAGFKEFDITLMVYGEDREDIKNRISDILSDLIGPVDMELDGWQHRFYGVLQKYDVKEHTDYSRDRFQSIKLFFSGYEYTESTATVSGTDSIEVTNHGNMESPIILTIMPTIGAASIAISGISRDSETKSDLPVTVKNLTTGKAVVLDGIAGIITEDGKAKAADVDIWTLPSLPRGKSTVTFSTNRLDAHIKVREIYM